MWRSLRSTWDRRDAGARTDLYPADVEDFFEIKEDLAELGERNVADVFLETAVIDRPNLIDQNIGIFF